MGKNLEIKSGSKNQVMKLFDNMTRMVENKWQVKIDLIEGQQVQTKKWGQLGAAGVDSRRS